VPAPALQASRCGRQHIVFCNHEFNDLGFGCYEGRVNASLSSRGTDTFYTLCESGLLL
jgi:hypothetical protein